LKQFSLLCLAVACAMTCRAAGIPPDPLENPGFQHFYNLEYDEALAAFTAQSAKDPGAPEPYNYIAQTILFRQMFKSGALGTELIASANSFLKRPKMVFSAADQKQFTDAVWNAINIAQARVKSNPKDVAAIYSLGVSHGVRANFDFMEKKWLDALSDASSARKLHTRVLELDANFHDARLIPGADEYVVGSLPRTYRLLTSVVGFSGDRAKGIQMLQTVAQSGRYNRFDAEALLSAIYRREKRPADAIAPINDLIQHFPRSYILRVELAEMYGDIGDRAKAMAAVDQMDELRRTGAPGFKALPEANIHYTRGGVLMQFNDLDKACDELKIATTNAAPMETSYAGSAWLRLGQIYDLKGQRQQAVEAYRQAMRVAPETDAAEQAKSLVSTKYKKPA
jgi:tetratricopeptide (TPR) repeat protein